MDPEAITTVARSAERLIICLSGAASLAMGWNLFKVGVVGPQSGELKGKDWSVKLQRCGPGIFFALFGAIILIFSIQGQLRLNPAAAAATATQTAQISYYGGQDAQSRLQMVQSINRIEADVSELQRELESDASVAAKIRLKTLDAAMANLKKLRDSMLVDQWGKKDLDFYKSSKANFRVTPSAFSEQDRTKLTEMANWEALLEVE